MARALRVASIHGKAGSEVIAACSSSRRLGLPDADVLTACRHTPYADDRAGSLEFLASSDLALP